VRLGNSELRAAYAVWPIGLAGGFLPNVTYSLYLLRRNRSWKMFRLAWPDTLLPILMRVLWMGCHSPAGTVPAYDSIGRHHNQCPFPGRPEAIKEDPEQFIQYGKSRAAAWSLEHCQLLTQNEIFNQQNLARVKQPNENASPKPQRTEHGLNS
jgi:hypothetical protein